MKVKSSKFLCSAVSPSEFPEYSLPEIAFVGRSNVGKSSLINTLLNRRGLAKTSSVPGKTRTLNFYLINNNFYFVDLPGYGYARVSKTERRDWKGLVESYFISHRDIRGIVLIVDIRRGIEKEEAMVIRWMDSLDIPVSLVLTKADKLSRNKRQRQLEVVLSCLDRDFCEVIPFSSLNREGRDRLWRTLQEWLKK